MAERRTLKEEGERAKEDDRKARWLAMSTSAGEQGSTLWRRHHWVQRLQWAA